MVAIAMTREMGTLGKDVAQGVADSLGLKVIHSELVEHDLAMRLGVQESAVHRYLEGGASVPVDTCVRIVRLLTDDPAFQESETSRAVLTDRLILTRSRSVLEALRSERNIGTGVEVAVTAGKVTLSGVIGQGGDLASAID